MSTLPSTCSKCALPHTALPYCIFMKSSKQLQFHTTHQSGVSYHFSGVVRTAPVRRASCEHSVLFSVPTKWLLSGDSC